jgi:hypothetical protein
MTTTKRKPPAMAPESGGLAIYDGQEFRGSILEIGAGFAAYDGDGRFVGAFKTLLEASRSIHASKQARGHTEGLTK